MVEDPDVSAAIDPTVIRRSDETTTIRRTRALWNRRAHNWDSHRSAGLRAVVAAVLRTGVVSAGEHVVDLGCGTGQLSLPLARLGALVTAVDVSPVMIDRLQDKVSGEGVAGVTAVLQPIERLSFPPESVDLVVSNYALHHLRDDDKAATVRAAFTWLCPGGYLVVGDMMFGRGSSPRDRRIIAAKAISMLRRGPAGWFRLAKNVVRFTLRTQERPVPVERWIGYLRDAGFVGVRAEPVVSEAAVVSGRRP